MSFDWHQYLELAHTQIFGARKTALEEAYNRSATSRAYYAVYCTAARTLRGRGVEIRKMDPHSFVIESFIKSPNKQEQEIGADLDRLKYQRVIADYKANKTITSKQAQLNYFMANQLYRKLSSL